MLRAVVPQRAPLFVEDKLNRAPHRQVLGTLNAQFLDCSRLAMRHLARPLTPIAQPVARAQFIEQDKVFQPHCVVATEALETLPGIAASFLDKGTRGLSEQGHFAAEDSLVLDR